MDHHRLNQLEINGTRFESSELELVELTELVEHRHFTNIDKALLKAYLSQFKKVTIVANGIDLMPAHSIYFNHGVVLIADVKTTSDKANYISSIENVFMLGVNSRHSWVVAGEEIPEDGFLIVHLVNGRPKERNFLNTLSMINMARNYEKAFGKPLPANWVLSITDTVLDANLLEKIQTSFMLKLIAKMGARMPSTINIAYDLLPNEIEDFKTLFETLSRTEP